MNDDAIFWERVTDMPPWEAEQELVLRREHNALQLSVLVVARSDLAVDVSRRGKQEYARLGAEMQAIHQQLTLINERVKYLRRLQDRINWRDAVKATLGDEAATACAVWIEQQWAEVHEQRREWGKK